MFPNFGEIKELEIQETDIHGGTIRGNEISMYDASKIVRCEKSLSATYPFQKF